VDPADARTKFALARVARLATVSAERKPHLVPIVFAMLEDDTIVTAVDAKPKRTTALKRLANIEAQPAVAVLADEYSEDWSQLWWVRADGHGRVVAPDGDPDLRARALSALSERYAPYRERPPESGAIVVIDVERWSGWTGS
jgi:PPOX class probable F420-dependent enzyme